MKDEWQLEMDRMLDAFENESESSLRKINRRFEMLGRPFNDEFRQLFMETSMNRLDKSFAKIKMERWNNAQVETSESRLDSDHERQNNRTMLNDGTSNNSRTAALNVILPEHNDEHLAIVKSRNVIEILDSDDGDDDIQNPKPTDASNTEGTMGYSDGASGTDQQSGGGKPKSTSNRNTHSKMNLVEITIPWDALIRCDSNRKSVRHPMENVNNRNDEGEFIGFMDEEEDISLARFDPKNSNSNEQTSSSSNIENRSKRSGGDCFECEDCHRVFGWKHHLKRHRRIHATGKLIGIKADSKGLYHCTLCVRQFNDVSHLSQHMKSHKDDRYLYECSRCMRRRFERKVDKEMHESQCKCRHYECHLCKVCVTVRLSDMQRHMRMHSGAKPFRCMVCDATFSAKHNLQHHLNSIHNGVIS